MALTKTQRVREARDAKAALSHFLLCQRPHIRRELADAEQEGADALLRAAVHLGRLLRDDLEERGDGNG